MRDIKLDISPAALLVLAILYFLDTSGLYAAALPAVVVHEMGHVLFLRLGGRRLSRISLGMFGLEMDYTGQLRGLMGALAIAAGPVFGLIYGLLIFTPSEYLCLSGGLSLALSIFNLLPVLPLDGGRLLLLAAGERAIAFSRGIIITLAGLALYFWFSRGWFSLFVMATWLAWGNFRSLLLEGKEVWRKP